MAANAKYAYLGEEDPSFRKAYDESGMDENMKELYAKIQENTPNEIRV